MPDGMPDGVAPGSAAPSVRIVLEPVHRPKVPAAVLRRIAAAHPEVAAHLPTGDPDRLVVGDGVALGHDPGDRSPFLAHVFDPVTNRGVELRGVVGRPDKAEVRPSALRARPQPAELKRAEAVLRADPGFPAAPGVIVYQPMPPLADLERPDGTSVRRPTLGVYNPAGGPRHQIVAVDLAAAAVDWHPAGVAAHTDDDCEEHLPEGVGSLRDRGGPDQVRVRVMRGDSEVWSLIVVRPRASAPQPDGSGVELLDVRYQGRRVLRQAHVPVLNVLYAEGITFRDWANQETRFSATGTDPVGWGWRVCSAPPRTILERPDSDAGDFQGVAFYHDGQELRIVSEIQAGWYRYMSDWRLADDGSIRPRFGFAGTKDPMTCHRHTHHAYWRLDFDLGAGGEVVAQLDDNGGLTPDETPISRETTRRRRGPVVGWQVRAKSGERGYRIWPGEHDGTADAFGVSDVWFLRHHPDELHDGGRMGEVSDTRAHIGRFLNDEHIEGADVVVWYAGHFTHDELVPEPHQGHITGPDLIPR
ncbi:hypothetical protein J5X84_26825 [Streptosporangiaceae bacterium NEAU-GS5]|nr:hypothetical protein [Streptosporangiaceae bacterium NEAU-GS5]